MESREPMSGEIDYWFIIHNLKSYNQHSDMIGNILRKPGIPEPKKSKFNDIKKGDKIVYYASGDYVIIGIFEITSDMRYLASDEYWGEIMIYKIKQVLNPPQGFYLDFKKLLLESDILLDMIPKKKIWGAYLHGQTCQKISRSDYLKLEEAILNKAYFRDIGDKYALNKN